MCLGEITDDPDSSKWKAYNRQKEIYLKLKMCSMEQGICTIPMIYFTINVLTLTLNT